MGAYKARRKGGPQVVWMLQVEPGRKRLRQVKENFFNEESLSQNAIIYRAEQGRATSLPLSKGKSECNILVARRI